jgi:hypothetical protein
MIFNLSPPDRHPPHTQEVAGITDVSHCAWPFSPKEILFRYFLGTVLAEGLYHCPSQSHFGGRYLIFSANGLDGKIFVELSLIFYATEMNFKITVNNCHGVLSNENMQLGTVVHTCNPAIWEAEIRRMKV